MTLHGRTIVDVVGEIHTIHITNSVLVVDGRRQLERLGFPRCDCFKVVCVDDVRHAGVLEYANRHILVKDLETTLFWCGS